MAPTDTRGHLTALVLLTDSLPADRRFLVGLVCPLLVPHSETSSLTPEQPAANTHCNMTARKRNKSHLSRCFLRELLKHTAATTSNTATTAIATNTFPFFVEATLKHPFQPSCRHVFTSFPRSQWHPAPASSSLPITSLTFFQNQNSNSEECIVFPLRRGPLEAFGGLRLALENVAVRGDWTNLQSDDVPSRPAEPVVSSVRLPVVTRGDICRASSHV